MKSGPPRRIRGAPAGALLAGIVVAFLAAACTTRSYPPDPNTTIPFPSPFVAGTPGARSTGACGPAPLLPCASPAAVQRFVQLARAGLDMPFGGSYVYLDTQGLPHRFEYYRWPGKPHLAASYLYESGLDGVGGFRAAYLGGGFYECLESTTPSCEGPDPDHGYSATAERFSYDIAPDYLSLLHPPADASLIRPGRVAGLPSTCLTYLFPGPLARDTWCITSLGVLDYFNGFHLFRPIQIVRIGSAELQPVAKMLPRKLRPWTTPWEERYPALAAPGWAL